MKNIGKNEVASIFRQLRLRMEKSREDLIGLDAAIGDGDLGLTMSKAFAAVDEKKTEIAARAADPGKMFALAGTEIARSAPSTMGTLLASAFMKAGKAVSGRETLCAADFSEFLTSFTEGIAELGAARRGDKTILDVLYPAAEAFSSAAEKAPDAEISTLLEKAIEAAEAGLEKSRGFMAKHGRPGIFREKTIGLVDPGGATGVLILRSFYEALST